MTMTAPITSTYVASSGVVNGPPVLVVVEVVPEVGVVGVVVVDVVEGV